MHRAKRDFIDRKIVDNVNRAKQQALIWDVLCDSHPWFSLITYHYKLSAQVANEIFTLYVGKLSVDSVSSHGNDMQHIFRLQSAAKNEFKNVDFSSSLSQIIQTYYRIINFGLFSFYFIGFESTSKHTGKMVGR